jgi:hypothetical protein
MTSRQIIPDRAEFVDALQALRRGHVLVRVHDGSGGCLLDGGTLYWSFQTLLDYELIREFANPDGFPHVQYFRITERGRDFADRACATWRQRPLLERLAMRMAG